jgi:hypothetical protein
MPYKPMNCIICGVLFERMVRTVTCSPECYAKGKALKSHRWRQTLRSRRAADPEYDVYQRRGTVRRKRDERARKAEQRRLEDERDRHIPPLDAMAKLTTRVYLPPATAARLRARIATYVEAQLPLAKEVIDGTRTWNPTQARVFSLMLNKVLPDLSASYIQQESIERPIAEMSREELERIASGSLITELAQTIEGEASVDYDPADPLPALESDPSPVR